MSIIGELYAEPTEEETQRLEGIWNRHPFFHPDCRYLGFNPVERAIAAGNSRYFALQIKDNFLPGMDDLSVQENLRDAMNLGISSINEFGREYLGGEARTFCIPEVGPPLDLFKLMWRARESWIETREGRHGYWDPALMKSAYEAVRAYGLGYRILQINESPEVLSSMRNFTLLRDWFKNQFGFRYPQVEHTGDFTYSFNTDADVRVFGTEGSPFRMRVKVLDESGNLRYGSLLRKLIVKGQYPNEMRDHVGIEFVVRNNADRERLVSYLRKEFKAIDLLEGYKVGRADRLDNFGQTILRGSSEKKSGDLTMTSFILRPPIACPSVLDHPLGGRIPPSLLYEAQGAEGQQLGPVFFERVPVEVQIITLKADEYRRLNQASSRKERKRGQFIDLLKVIFPRDIYFPLLAQEENGFQAWGGRTGLNFSRCGKEERCWGVI